MGAQEWHVQARSGMVGRTKGADGMAEKRDGAPEGPVPEEHVNMGPGVGLALGAGMGLALGAGLGAALGNIGLWLPIGIAIGTAFGVAFGVAGKKR